MKEKENIMPSYYYLDSFVHCPYLMCIFYVDKIRRNICRIFGVSINCFADSGIQQPQNWKIQMKIQNVGKRVTHMCITTAANEKNNFFLFQM